MAMQYIPSSDAVNKLPYTTFSSGSCIRLAQYWSVLFSNWSLVVQPAKLPSQNYKSTGAREYFNGFPVKMGTLCTLGYTLMCSKPTANVVSCELLLTFTQEQMFY